MAHRARVTIGMPVWNGERFLRQAIESVIAQTFSDLELVISDNGSTDRTQEICEAYAARDPRVCYVRNETNRGAAWNYNNVFSLSQSKYFKWAAHDDYLAPELIARCVEALDADAGAVLCYSGTTIVDADGSAIEDLDYALDLETAERRRRYRQFCRYFARLQNFHCNPVFGVIRAEALRETALIGAYWGSDAVLLGELALRGRFRRLSEPLFFRRDHKERAMLANRTLESLTTWFDPRKTGRWRFPRWRCLLEQVRSIGRVRMSLRDRLSCWWSLLRSTRWRYMARDLRNAARGLHAGRTR